MTSASRSPSSSALNGNTPSCGRPSGSSDGGAATRSSGTPNVVSAWIRSGQARMAHVAHQRDGQPRQVWLGAQDGARASAASGSAWTPSPAFRTRRRGGVIEAAAKETVSKRPPATPPPRMRRPSASPPTARRWRDGHQDAGRQAGHGLGQRLGRIQRRDRQQQLFGGAPVGRARGATRRAGAGTPAAAGHSPALATTVRPRRPPSPATAPHGGAAGLPC